MIRAYDNQYLDDAMRCLGEAMDYAANSCHITMDEFLNLFIGTGYAESFAAGAPKYVSGVSGTELVITMQEIEKLYPTLHEASEKKFVDTVNRMIRKKNLPTRLQSQRKICGYSQRELAGKVGVNLRTLQQYEIRAKDINKAAGVTLLALSKALGCRMEDLLEYDSSEVEDHEEI